MKPETRILTSTCRGSLCVAVIVRGHGVDGALASCTGCDGICRKAEEKGYMGELRYHLGPCSCNLPPYPGSHPHIETFLENVLNAIELAARTGIRLSDSDPVT